MPYEGKHWTSSNQAPAYVEKSNDTGDNHPDEAFIYPGHGFEPNPKDGLVSFPVLVTSDELIKLPTGDYPKRVHEVLGQSLIEFNTNVIIPKGIIVVAKSHSGDVRFLPDIMKDKTYLFNRKNSEYFLDPIKHISKINDMLGNVAIYREGDSCPNFFNSRILNTTTHLDRTLGCIVSAVGTIKIPFPDNLTDEFLLQQANLKMDKTILWDNNNTKMSDIKGWLNNNKSFIFDNLFKICGGTENTQETFIKFMKHINELNIYNLLFSTYLENSSLQTNLKKEIDTIKLKGDNKPKVLYFLSCRSRNSSTSKLTSEETRLGTTDLKSIIVSSNNSTHSPIISKLVAGIKFGPWPWPRPRPASPIRPKTINLSNAMINQVENTIIKRNKNERNKLRKRVSSLSNTIRTQISEALVQRRLSGKAYIEKNAEQYQLRQADPSATISSGRADNTKGTRPATNQDRENIEVGRQRLQILQSYAEEERKKAASKAAAKAAEERKKAASKAAAKAAEEAAAALEAAKAACTASPSCAAAAEEAKAAGWYMDYWTIDEKIYWRPKDPNGRWLDHVPTREEIEEERHRRENTITGFHIRRGLRKFGWNKTANFLDRHIGSKKRTRKNRRNKSGF